MNSLIEKAKKNFYKDRLEASSGNQKKLFGCINELLNKSKSTSLPSHTSKKDLADDFSDYFMDKVNKIRQSLEEIQSSNSQNAESSDSPTILSVLAPATEDEVRKIIRSSSSTTCASDPMPTPLMKECLDILLPTITHIINRSLAESEVPETFKLAIILPLLKKESLDPEIFKHYRPIANLPFLSKVLERVVAARLDEYAADHPNKEIMQSSYKRHHSTETALLKIQNDILLAIDQQQCVLLLLLDLSAAFDTVDHSILLHRLQHRFGITGAALKWISSYFENRKQQVFINGCKSKAHTLTCNVPQGSVLGPKFFIDYESPLGSIIRSHGLQAHFYADDTQIYLAFNPNAESTATESLLNCVADIRSWMASNFLKLNDDKTELLLLGSHQNLLKLNTESISVGECNILPSSSVRNIGCIFDPQLKMDLQVSLTCKSAWYRLHQIGKIRPYLTVDETKSAIHAYVTSKIDQNNSLLQGVSDCLIFKLQKVQNAAAKLIFRQKKHDHVTPLLKELHWLPVTQRITFKILLLTYKALHNEAPPYLKELLTHYEPKRTLRSSSDTSLLVIPKTRLKTFGDRAFKAAAPRLWNDLPRNIRDSDSTAIFKKRLKTLLFSNAFD